MSAFNLAALRDAQRKLEAIGPVPFFASHTLLPNGGAWRFTFKNVEYVGAHPDFWAKLPTVRSTRSLHTIPIHNLDLDDGKRIQFYQALAGAFASGGAA